MNYTFIALVTKMSDSINGGVWNCPKDLSNLETSLDDKVTTHEACLRRRMKHNEDLYICVAGPYCRCL